MTHRAGGRGSRRRDPAAPVETRPKTPLREPRRWRTDHPEHRVKRQFWQEPNTSESYLILSKPSALWGEFRQLLCIIRLSQWQITMPGIFSKYCLTAHTLLSTLAHGRVGIHTMLWFLGQLWRRSACVWGAPCGAGCVGVWDSQPWVLPAVVLPQKRESCFLPNTRMRTSLPDYKRTAAHRLGPWPVWSSLVNSRRKTQPCSSAP